MELTKEGVREAFEYKEGNLYYRKDEGYNRAGDRAGIVTTGTYIRIHINGKDYPAHRLIYLYHHGYLPKQIDHINRKPYDNRIENLREATASQNCANSKIRTERSSKFKGVVFKRDAGRRKPWQATIGIKRHHKHLGMFATEEEAARAYDRAAIEAWGDYAHTNEDAGMYI